MEVYTTSTRKQKTKMRPALGHLLGLNTSMPAPIPALLARLGWT
jgi:hypothetical protein